MPLLPFPKQRLHPDSPFPHRCRVGGRVVVLPDALAVLLVKRAIEFAAFAAVGTPRADRASLTGGGRGLVDAHLGNIVVATWPQDRSARTSIDILLSIIAEVTLAEERTGLAPLRQRDVGANSIGCQACEILPRAIGRVADRSFGAQLPAEADAPEQVQHRGVLHHVGGGDQRV